MAEIAGLKLIVPSSVSAGTGTASVSASGKVTFTSADNVSVNGVFSATHDNYLIVIQQTGPNGENAELRWRASGSDASGSNYVRQFLNANSTTVSGSRDTQSVFNYGVGSTNPDGYHIYIYGPFLTQPTAARSVTALSSGGARIVDLANTHSLSTSYDGFTLRSQLGTTFTGTLTVYGLSQ